MGRKTKTCIFAGRPSSCTVCLDSRKLQCLIDRSYLAVSKNGYAELRRLLRENVNSIDRTKTDGSQDHGKF